MPHGRAHANVMIWLAHNHHDGREIVITLAGSRSSVGLTTGSMDMLSPCPATQQCHHKTHTGQDSSSNGWDLRANSDGCRAARAESQTLSTAPQITPETRAGEHITDNNEIPWQRPHDKSARHRTQSDKQPQKRTQDTLPRHCKWLVPRPSIRSARTQSWAASIRQCATDKQRGTHTHSVCTK